jgi:hypothetical protein
MLVARGPGGGAILPPSAGVSIYKSGMAAPYRRIRPNDSDRIEGLPIPEFLPCWGRMCPWPCGVRWRAAAQCLADHGPPGIGGKATLAYRIAGHLFAHGATDAGGRFVGAANEVAARQ